MPRIVFALLLGIALASCSLLADSRLEGAVLKALAADSRTLAYDFEVSHQGDGTVLITGEVSNLVEAEAVKEIAERVPGVSKVLNRASVAEPGSNMLQDEVIVTPYL